MIFTLNARQAVGHESRPIQLAYTYQKFRSKTPVVSKDRVEANGRTWLIALRCPLKLRKAAGSVVIVNSSEAQAMRSGDSIGADERR